MTSENYWDFDLTIPYLYEQKLWWAPTPAPRSLWKNIIYVFKLDLWIILLISSITYISIWLILERYQNRTINILSLAISIIGIFLQVSQNINKSSIRSLLVLWIWFSLILSTVFNARFYELLKTIGYDLPVETIEEAAFLENWKYCFSTVNEKHIEMLQPDVAKILFANRIRCNLTKIKPGDCVPHMALRGDVALLVGKYQAQFGLPDNNLTVSKKQKLMYPLKSHLPYGIYGALFVKGYPLYDQFNIWVQRLLENGIIAKLVEDFESTSYINLAEDRPELAIRVQHILVALIALACGFLISVITFCAEICYWIIWKHPSNLYK